MKMVVVDGCVIKADHDALSEADVVTMLSKLTSLQELSVVVDDGFANWPIDKSYMDEYDAGNNNIDFEHTISRVCRQLHLVPNLTELELYGGLEDTDVEIICEVLPRLTHLKLGMCDIFISNDTFYHIARVSTLISLELRCMSSLNFMQYHEPTINESALQQFHMLSQLRSLTLFAFEQVCAIVSMFTLFCI